MEANIFDFSQTTFKPMTRVGWSTKHKFDNINQRFFFFIESHILLDCVCEASVPVSNTNCAIE